MFRGFACDKNGLNIPLLMSDMKRKHQALSTDQKSGSSSSTNSSSHNNTAVHARIGSFVEYHRRTEKEAFELSE
jgi:hypothetical protein